MSNQLIVNFPWKLRRQNTVPPSGQVKSQSTVYRGLVRNNDPKHYSEMLVKDSERKKAQYKGVGQICEEKAAEQRIKWRQAKKAQRTKSTKNVPQDECQTKQPDPPRKKIKMMTAVERKEYNRQKKQDSRSRKTIQKKVRDQQRDRSRKIKITKSVQANKKSEGDQAMSRASLYRQVKSIQDQMPQSPRSYATVIDKVISNSTPRKQKELENKGVKRKLDDSFCCITYSIKKKLGYLRSRQMTEKERQHYKILTHAACRATAKYPRMKKKVASLLGVGGKVLRQTQLKRALRKDTLSQATKDQVRRYWKSEAISREVPLKKRVKKGEPPFLLECSYSEAYKRFHQSHPNVKIGYCKFIACKPKNVMHMKAMERIVCCCIKCENVKLKVQALNQEMTKIKSSDLRIKHMDDLAAKTVCPPVNGQLNIKCLNRECAHCGVDAVRQHYMPVTQTHGEGPSVNTGVTFDQWKTIAQEIIVKSKDAAGTLQKKMVRRLKRVTCNGTNVEEVTDLLMTDMKTYPAHKFRADWQKAEFDKLKTNMPPKSAIVVVDFAMNYTCFLQDEVQSYHWSPPQVTIHPCYAYINSSMNVAAPTHTEAIIIISPDPQHDAAAVSKFLSLCSEHLKEMYPGITEMFQFSDCCASQYRCSTSFADISLSQQDIGLHVQRNYFESSHGKSPADGQGAVIKRAATMAVTRREAQIRSSEEFYEFCQQKLTDVGQGVYPSRQMEYQNAKRTFIFVKSEDINRNRPERQVKPVKGTMNIHCVKASGTPYNIQTRYLSCFCDGCLYGVEQCNNADTVGAWTNVQLRPKTVIQRVQIEADASVDNSDADGSHATGDPVDSATRELVDAMEAEQTSQVICVDKWVAVIYDEEWWPGVVEYIEEGVGASPKYRIKFMKPSSSTVNRFTWPMGRAETDCLPREEILTIIGEPPKPVSRRHYCFTDNVYQAVQRVFQSLS